MSVSAKAAPRIIITDQAVKHFNQLIEKENTPGMGLRMYLDSPGLPTADVSIAFCPPGEHRAQDVAIPCEGFTLYVDGRSAPYLDEAEIDYKQDQMGGQLAITAPHLKGEKPNEEASLEDRINYILHTEINPSLSSHGGMVTLVEITDNNEVVLRFGGGCHGCGMVDVTLKQGIEKSLKEQIPEITAVIDSTDHTTGENPYY